MNYLKVLTGSIALMLSACGFDQPVPTSHEVPGAEEIAPDLPAVADDDGPEGSDQLSAFTDDILADGKAHFRFDRTRDARGGGKERQVFIEMIGMSDVEAADATAKSLNSLGFEQGRRWGDENGVRISYKTPEGRSMRVLVRSREAHSKLNREDATSSVYITMPIDD